MAKSKTNLLDLLDSMAPAVRRAFIQSIEDITSQAQLAVIARHIQNGNVEAALTALNLSPEFFAPLDDALRNAYVQGGAAALAGLPVIPDPFPAGELWLALMLETHERKRTFRGSQEIA